MTSGRVAARAFLASVAQEARDGHLRLVCPFCSGGANSERSLVLTIGDDGTFYCCHRASCGETGQLGSNSARLLGASQSKKSKGSGPYTGEILSANFTDAACARWRAAPRGPRVLHPSEIGLYTDSTYTTEVWFLRDFWNMRRGVQVRRLGADSSKVVRSYKDDSEYASPLYSAYTANPHGAYWETPLWIVEDPLSAAVIRSWELNSLALCGTVLHNDTLRDMEGAYGAGARETIVALDPGAEGAAHRILQQLQASFSKPVRVQYLPCDIKNMSVKDARATLLGVLP